jgi:hypothetical protein
MREPNNIPENSSVTLPAILQPVRLLYTALLAAKGRTPAGVDRPDARQQAGFGIAMSDEITLTPNPAVALA